MAFIEIPVADNAILTEYNITANEGLFINRGTGLSPSWFFRITFDIDGGQKDSDESITIHKGVSTSYLQVVPNLVSIQIETRDCRQAIADVLKRLTALDRVLTIYDYCYLRDTDLSQGYSVRYMILTESVTPLGAMTYDNRWGNIGLGWRIQLQAIDYD